MKTAETILSALVNMINIKPVGKIEDFDDNDARIRYEWFELIAGEVEIILRIDDPLNCGLSFDFNEFIGDLKDSSQEELASKFNELISELIKLIKDKHKSSEEWRRNETWGTESGALEALTKIKAAPNTKMSDNQFDNFLDEATHAVKGLWEEKGWYFPEGDSIYKLNDALTAFFADLRKG